MAKKDISPLLVIEAGYLPVISSRRFAIPELVDHERTGLLLDDSSQASTVTSAMCWMLEHANEYQQMRRLLGRGPMDSIPRRKFEEHLPACVTRFSRRQTAGAMKILFLGQIGPGQTGVHM